MPLKYFLTFLSIIYFFVGNSQTDQEANPIFDVFSEYVKAPREVAYVHLNKSVYLKGETLAFTAYVYEKGEKKLSQLTSNLYCTISDDHGKTIKSKMFLVAGGVSQGSFYVDSLFASGNYTFKAYTNWMKNFDEQNFYIQSIKVIDPETESEIVPKVISHNLDAQFLPEGGHLVANTKNTIGVVIKDSLGFGVPFIEGQLLNSKNEIITVFKTNQFGIGNFMFTPKDNEFYQASIDFGGTRQVFKINVAESFGVALSLVELQNKVVIQLSTNESTLKSIKNKRYKLTFHNGRDFKAVDVAFNDDTEILKVINFDDLFPGINIFTLFNENNVPLLERQFFKYDGIEMVETNAVSYSKEQDSTLISIPFKNIDSNVFNNFSISVLPNDTKSYNHHHNIISYVYLQPYVKGFIENAQYYFTEITKKKKYELDNLLMTQGWSSYDWNTVFNYPPSVNYNFEIGVNLKANINNASTGKFVLYPTPYNNLEIFEVDENTRFFERNGLFPLDTIKLKISEIRKNSSVKKSGVYAQFSPSKIPDLEKYTKILPLKENVLFDSNTNQQLLQTTWEKVEYEKLDEIIIIANKKKEKIEKLKNTSWGTVDVFDDAERNRYMYLSSYLRVKGFVVTEDLGTLQIRNRSPRSFMNDPSPVVYLDDRLLMTLDELYYYSMDFVDYIIIDKSGHGEGMRGAGGVIKIYTDPLISNSSYLRTYQEIEVPLTFATPTKFYTPRYNSYQSSFFKEYGVIDWLPAMSVDENGDISFKISNLPGTDIKLFIEGTANNGAFISEVKTIKIN